MFGSLFKKQKESDKLAKEYAKHLEKARDMQRSGDLKTYASMMEKAQEMEQTIENLRKEGK